MTKKIYRIILEDYGNGTTGLDDVLTNYLDQDPQIAPLLRISNSIKTREELPSDFIDQTLSHSYQLDPYGQILFLAILGQYFLYKDKTEACLTLGTRLKGIKLSPQEDPVIKNLKEYFTSYFCSDAQRYQILQNLSDKLNPNTHVCFIVWLNLIDVYLEFLDLDKFHRLFNQISDPATVINRKTTEVITFWKTLQETGELPSFQDTNEKSNDVERARYLYDYIDAYRKLHTTLSIKTNKYPFLSNDQTLILKTKQAFLKNQPQEALEIIQNQVNPLNELHIKMNFLATFLANKMPKSARAILDEITESFPVGYLLDFYWARYHLLLNETTQARHYFRKFYLHLKKNNASWRFRQEINQACEIDRVQMVDLMSQDLFSINNNETQKDNIIPIQAKQMLSSPEAPLRIPGLIGSGEWHDHLSHQIEAFTNQRQPILIQGETGSGKEVVAKALHALSERKNEPFLSINCGALTPSLIESELFGHAKGSFTGATQNYQGLIASAEKGTLFLDEIGDMPLDLQTKLLRVIEHREFRSIGTTKNSLAHCHFIAATHHNLKKLIQENKFREDLFYRLSPLVIHLPPLRERKHDILSIAMKHISKLRDDSENVMLDDKLIQALESYSWPGNVREIQHILETMVILNRETKIYNLTHLNDNIRNLILSTESENYSHVSSNLNKIEKRRQSISNYIYKNKKANRHEISQQFDITTATVTTDLKTLIVQGKIRKVMPNSSPRSHFFISSLA